MGWASTVAITGILINIDPHYNFYVSTVAGLLFLVCVWTLRSGRFSLSAVDVDTTSGKADKVTISTALSITKLPALWALVVYVGRLLDLLSLRSAIHGALCRAL